MRGRQIARDNHQLAITRPIFIGGKFHREVRKNQRRSKF
jgi:hypothetical protein